MADSKLYRRKHIRDPNFKFATGEEYIKSDRAALLRLCPTLAANLLTLFPYPRRKQHKQADIHILRSVSKGLMTGAQLAKAEIKQRRAPTESRKRRGLGAPIGLQAMANES